MRNIMKATLYRICKGKEIKYAVFALIAFSIITIVMSTTQVQFSHEAMISGSIDNLSFFGILIVLGFNCAVIGNDFRDKTLNYEVMSGHSRTEVFVGRLLICTIISILLFILLFSFSISMIYSFIYDSFSIQISLYEIFPKILLCSYIALFYSILFVCITFMTRNLLVALGGSWCTIILSWTFSLLDAFIKIDTYPISYILGIYSFRNIFRDTLTIEYCMYIVLLYSVGIVFLLLFTRKLFRNCELA